MKEIKRFIIVDDDISNNHLCAFIIEKVARKIEVIQFINPVEALEFIALEYQQSIGTHTVLLLDITMPIISGWEFLKRFETLEGNGKEDIQVYILTTSENHADRKTAEQNKYVRSYVVKPLTAGVVQNILNGLI